MNHGLYTIKDKLGDDFAPIFMSKNDQTALRAARQTASRTPVLVVKDYELYNVGVFNDETGVIVPNDRPRLIAVDLMPIEDDVPDVVKVPNSNKVLM